jgi:hypothetical protein
MALKGGNIRSKVCEFTAGIEVSKVTAKQEGE